MLTPKFYKRPRSVRDVDFRKGHKSKSMWPPRWHMLSALQDCQLNRPKFLMCYKFMKYHVCTNPY